MTSGHRAGRCGSQRLGCWYGVARAAAERGTHSGLALAEHAPRDPRRLIDSEREEFERRYAEEMAEAARTLDLTGVLSVLDVYRKIAEITERQGVEAHRRMLDRVTRLQRGEDVPIVPGCVHKAEINARLGH